MNKQTAVSSGLSINEKSLERWIQADKDYVQHPHPVGDDIERIIIVDGKDCTLVDIQGREYLDAHAGAWLVQVGHGREELADIASAQLKKQTHFSIYWEYSNLPLIALSERLVSLAPDNISRVRYCCSGSEADDEAMQIVRYYHHVEGNPERKTILSLRGSYHGRTIGGWSLAGCPIAEIAPYPGDVAQVATPTPYRNECPEGEDLVDFCIRDLERTIEEIGADKIAALIGEPMMGPAGMIPLPKTYWPRVEEVLRKHGILFIMDEVVTGAGRIGEWYASNYYGITPDILLLAKGLASGYMPIGALLLSEEVSEVVKGLKGTGSFGGHATACAVALASYDIIERENLLENTKARGEQFMRELAPLAALPAVGDIRGEGLMIGVELVTDKNSKEPMPNVDVLLAREIRKQSGVILDVRNSTICITPPLIITEQEVTRIVTAIKDAVERLNPDGSLNDN